MEQSHEERWRRSVTYREGWYKARIEKLEAALREIAELSDVSSDVAPTLARRALRGS